jgi:hypothetical protein
MFEKMIAATSLTSKSSKQVKIILGLVAGIGIGMASHASAQVLYTTTSDFTGWSTDAPTVVSSAQPSSAWDFDGSTTNGLGNATPGTSPGGSLALTVVPSASGQYTGVSSSPGLAYVNPALQAIDPGAIAAYSAASNYGNGTLVNYSNSFIFTYTIATGTMAYEDVGLSFNENGPGGSYYNPQFADGSAVYNSVGGFTTVTKTIPYSIQAGSFNDMHIQIFANWSISGPTSPIYIDDIQVASVPEPASIGLLGSGLTFLMVRRRRAASKV